jgi:hypothetical protein
MTLSNVSWQPISNELNTFADSGLRPLSYNEVRARLITDILFMSNVVVPGQSLLCNPATAQWIKTDPELIEWLMRNGRIVALLHKEEPSFQDLLAGLEARKSVALKWINKRTLEETAKELDNVYSESHGAA